MFNRWIAKHVIAFAKKRPYRKGHIYKNGQLYMGRYSLFETKWLSCRVHHIATPDQDRGAMHDHPWWFLSRVLRGWYVEERPKFLDPMHDPEPWKGGKEKTVSTVRFTGSWAFRRATDRHYISYVSGNVNEMPLEVVGEHNECWTIFFYGPVRQWWGFFTPQGKIHWRDFTKAGETKG